MEVRDSEVHRPQMELTLSRHALRPVDLLIVPDIAAWAVGRCGNARGNPTAMAVVDQATGGWAVLVRQAISSAQVKSILDRIEWNGKHAANAVLDSPEKFMRHLVLHELAHLANNWDQEREDDCDDWAFERLHEL
jgi:demethoxyubiquinone hydroxylase (CLK1/Coq7/Cat5 family)